MPLAHGREQLIEQPQVLDIIQNEQPVRLFIQPALDGLNTTLLIALVGRRQLQERSDSHNVGQ